MRDSSKTKRALIQELASLRKRMMELEQSESERQRIFEASCFNDEILVNMGVGVHLARAEDGIIVYANNSFERMFGFDPGELVGKHVSILNASGSNSPEFFANEIIKSLEQTGGWNGEVQNIRKDGTTFWCYATVSKFKQKKYGKVWISLHRDITDLKLSENRLCESEEKYRNLFENSITGISQALPDGQLIIANNTYAHMYGYENAEEMMIELSNVGQLYVNMEDRKEVLCTLKEKGVMEPREIAVVRRDGTRFTVLAGAREIRDSKGNLKCYQAEHIDITNRKQAEEALRRSAENFRHSLENSPMGIRIVTQEGETIYANRAILDIYGYDSLEDLKTTPAEKRYTPESYAEFVIRREIRQQGIDDPSEYTVDIIRKEGEVRSLWALRRATLWNGERQFQVLYKDITEQKQAEEALRKSQDQLREAHQLAHIGIWNWAADTDTVTWTKELYRIAGLDPTLPAPTYAEHANIYAPESWLLLKESVERALKIGEPYQLELKLMRPDGTPRWINAFGGVTNDRQGRIQGLHGTVQDITDRKRAEEESEYSAQQLRALADRLQQIREEERVTIAREIHDEMGGGLTGLKMELSAMLQQMEKANAGQEMTDLSERMHVSNELINQMIKEVRRIATSLRPSVLDDLGLIAALEWQLREFTNRTEIPHEFVTSLEDVELADITATAVFRIFQEALTNVARHSGATKVTVLFREEEERLSRDRRLSLEIRDNGRGITEDEIMGLKSLGLLGMKERVLVFGGELAIQGDPGRGTTLTLKIPQRRGKPS